MSDQGSTLPPGLRDVVAEDASRERDHESVRLTAQPLDEQVETRAIERWARFEGLLGRKIPWSQVGDHIRNVYRQEARDELAANVAEDKVAESG